MFPLVGDINIAGKENSFDLYSITEDRNYHYSSNFYTENCETLVSGLLMFSGLAKAACIRHPTLKYKSSIVSKDNFLSLCNYRIHFSFCP